jgi:hypothetical protein
VQSRYQASGCKLLAAGYWLLAAGCWLQATGYWLLASGFRLLATGYWLLANVLNPENEETKKRRNLET